MIRMFKRWLINRFLPEYCREEMIKELNELRQELTAEREENARLRSYINGMNAALRVGRKIVIKNGGASGGDRERAEKQQ